ncbi:hypothetical protein LJC10_05940 [Selenomonadales bacterium OttesenSCG-928-I06]|nr:hypothetical protein [Selenomonadales bacterium OttesenSCG-928-I06]
MAKDYSKFKTYRDYGKLEIIDFNENEKKAKRICFPVPAIFAAGTATGVATSNCYPKNICNPVYNNLTYGNAAPHFYCNLNLYNNNPNCCCKPSKYCGQNISFSTNLQNCNPMPSQTNPESYQYNSNMQQCNPRPSTYNQNLQQHNPKHYPNNQNPQKCNPKTIPCHPNSYTCYPRPKAYKKCKPYCKPCCYKKKKSYISRDQCSPTFFCNPFKYK